MLTFFATTSTFAHSLEHIAGFIFVITTLGALWLTASIFGQIFIRLNKKKPAPAAKATPVAAEREIQKPGVVDLAEEEIAVVCSAVTAIMGTRSRIVSVKGANPDWSREGRRDHFASHRIR